MRKIKFAFGIHNHQPVGNFDFVFEDAYNKAYLPFLELLEKHPSIKIAQHYSGILFEWILDHYPQFVQRLKALVQRGQVEMITGGYYEPILINIPDDDKFGQIDKLSQFIKKHTGYHPTGLWLAERIWEPQLAGLLATADIKYTIIDDSHFKSAGLRDSDLNGYYITEDKGEILNIFPISEKLRYTIPFQNPEVTIEYLRSLATEDGNNLIVFADDGEKFGIWPETHRHCYENKWLERFFAALENNSDWIEIVHFSEALEKLLPLGKVYLPTASYREMMEWALPTQSIHEYENFERHLKDCQLFDRFKVFVRGGFWRNFLAKYEESNNLHKKALYVHKKITAVSDKLKSDEKYIRALNHLWAGQCNCPYWHGVFGGLYLNNLRYAVYKNMIQAEELIDQLTRKSEKKGGWIDYHQFDFNADGRDELIVETSTLNLYFAPDYGGALFELDYKPKAINILDTMKRYEEAYHRKLLQHHQPQHNNQDGIASIHDLVVMKEEGLNKKLHYDSYRRSSLIDHFLHPETTLDSIITSNYKEAGDFIGASYQCKTDKQNDQLHISFYREGTVRMNDATKKLSVKKDILVLPADSVLKITYCLKNLEDTPLRVWFAPEFNVALLAGNAPDRYYYTPDYELKTRNLASSGIVNKIETIGLKDEWLGVDIKFNFNKAAAVWRYPVETISQSEGGFERVYQSSVVLPNWNIELRPFGEWDVVITKKIMNI